MEFRFKKYFFSALVSLVVLISLILVGNFVFRNIISKPSVSIDLSRPSVVMQIQSLGNLETAAYTIEKIIEVGQEGNVFQDLLYGDRILLIANGKVIAGVDLTKITEQDVEVNGTYLTINLPPPLILSSNLDSSKTKVYDRTQGFLSRGNKDLESQARASAEASIRQAACDSGILLEARDNAIERMKELFKFSGFTNVEVKAPNGTCL